MALRLDTGTFADPIDDIPAGTMASPRRGFELWQSERRFPLLRIALIYGAVIFILQHKIESGEVGLNVTELFAVRVLVALTLLSCVFMSFWMKSEQAYEVMIYLAALLLSVGSGYISAHFEVERGIITMFASVNLGWLLIGLVLNVRSLVIVTMMFFAVPAGVFLYHSGEATLATVGWLNLGSIAITAFLLGAIILRYRKQVFVQVCSLDEISTHDVLTGVLNRRGIMDELGLAKSRYERHGEVFSLLYLDIDHFKKINDTYGHDGGDLALKAFCSICRSHLRQIDRMGRLGGEEFLILLPRTDVAGAHVVAERIRDSVARTPVICGRARISMSTSIGLAQVEAPEVDLDRILKQADRALYSAKEGGRNRSVVAQPGA